MTFQNIETKHDCQHTVEGNVNLQFPGNIFPVLRHIQEIETLQMRNI